MTDEIKARVGEILVWYDGPLSQELTLKGRVGESMCYDMQDRTNLYVAFFPEPGMMARYRARAIDLLTLMCHEDTERFSFTDRDYTEDGSVVLHPMARPFAEEMLPEPGFFHGDL